MRAEQPLVPGEVFPDRAADRVTGAVGAAEVIDHFGDQFCDDADVIELMAGLVEKSLLLVDRSGSEPRYRPCAPSSRGATARDGV